MSIPAFSVGVAFTDDPNVFSPTYTELAGELETMTIARGRQSDEDQAQTGVADIALRDTTRKYDPNNSAGPFFGNLLPTKQLRVQATVGATTYPLFRGWVDIQNGWVREEAEAGSALVRLPANDGFEVLNLLMTDGLSGLSSKTTGNRIGDALFLKSQGFFGGSLDVGRATVQAWPAAVVSVLSLIRDAELTEPGFFFLDGQCRAVFHDRQHRLVGNSVATFCDKANYSAGRILYGACTTRRTLIVNDVLTTRPGGVQQEASDAASLAAHFQRPKSYSTQHVSDADALAYAQWQLSLKKDSYEVLESLTFSPGTEDAAWVQMLSRELGDRITVVRTPSGGGSPVTQDYFIEALTLNIGPGPDASCTWRLSASASQFGYWQAGIVGFSEAGTTTRAAY